MVRPAVSHRYDFEGELAFIVGRGGRHIPASDALARIAGYSCYNDGSVRDFQRHASQFTAGKNFWHSGAFGPWMVTADEIPDPAGLALETRLNGKVMQSASTGDLVFDIPCLVEYLSTIFPLRAGGCRFHGHDRRGRKCTQAAGLHASGGLDRSGNLGHWHALEPGDCGRSAAVRVVGAQSRHGREQPLKDSVRQVTPSAYAP